MLKKVIAVAAVGALAALPATPAAAAASVCYSVSVTVNGDTVVDEASCVEA